MGIIIVYTFELHIVQGDISGARPGEEREKGSLETGKIADLAILTEDPLTCPEENIKNIMAKTTIVGGKIVHQLEDAI